MEFFNNNGQKVSGKAIPMAILVMDQFGEGNLDMVTTFYHHNQAKVETFKALTALHQCGSPEPSVVVVRSYTYSPFLPQGSFSFLYLDMTTLSGDASSVQFPLGQLCLCRLLPYSNTKVVLPWKEGEEELVYPFFQETLWKSSKEEYCSSNQILLSVSLSPPIPIEKKASRWRKDLAFIWL